jgi:hypothetical protein
MPRTIDPAAVEDFFALGYSYCVIKLLYDST